MADTKLFDVLEDALADMESVLNTSEVHGLLVGAMAAGLPLDETAWIPLMSEQVNRGQRLPNACMNVLSELYQQERQLLTERSHEFEPLLPLNAPLYDRLYGLSKFCEGFLLGFGLLSQKLKLDEQAQEVLGDLRDISMVELDVEADEELENAYEHVFEHVRVAVQLLFSEYSALPPKPESQSVH